MLSNVNKCNPARKRVIQQEYMLSKVKTFYLMRKIFYQMQECLYIAKMCKSSAKMCYLMWKHVIWFGEALDDMLNSHWITRFFALENMLTPMDNTLSWFITRFTFGLIQIKKFYPTGIYKAIKYLNNVSLFEWQFISLCCNKIIQCQCLHYRSYAQPISTLE